MLRLLHPQGARPPDGASAADRVRALRRHRGGEARRRGSLAGGRRPAGAPDRGADRGRDRGGDGDRGAGRADGRRRRRRYQRDGGDLARRDRRFPLGPRRRLRDGRGDHALPAHGVPARDRVADGGDDQDRDRLGDPATARGDDRGPRPASADRPADGGAVALEEVRDAIAGPLCEKSSRRSATRSRRRRRSSRATSPGTGSCSPAAARWSGASRSSSRRRPGCRCISAESPLTCVAFGSGQALDHFDRLSAPAGTAASPSRPTGERASRAARLAAGHERGHGAGRGRIRNASIGSRNRGVSALTSTDVAPAGAGPTRPTRGAPEPGRERPRAPARTGSRSRSRPPGRCRELDALRGRRRAPRERALELEQAQRVVVGDRERRDRMIADVVRAPGSAAVAELRLGQVLRWRTSARSSGSRVQPPLVRHLVVAGGRGCRCRRA